ncbi:MAG: hypothetical protein AUK44_00155 [Porphyromonadaceae bacterium CG2_30_38_12]|nr:MAG: hypothetical protein AUK44_00155 [Porphyromonadaceae bacterium CG2_30_38_12]
MKTKFRIVQLFAVAILALTIASCQNDLDGLAMNKIGEVQSVQSTKTISMEVVVKDAYWGQFLYTVQIFDADPLAVSQATANILKSGVSNKDIPFLAKIEVPEFAKTIYVMQTDYMNKKVVKSIDVSAITSALTCDFR